MASPCPIAPAGRRPPAPCAVRARGGCNSARIRRRVSPKSPAGIVAGGGRLGPLKASGSGVAEGQDGWLYWVGRAREVEAFYGDTATSRRILTRWTRLIGRRARRLDSLGIRHVHTVVPDKLAIYPDLLGRPFPGLADPPGLRLARAVAQDSAAAMVDLQAPLLAARVEEPVYLRTDTH